MLLKDLQTLATKLATGTLFHVEKAGKAYSVDYSALAKAIIEEYADSTVGGSKQSVQAAIAALNSRIAVAVTAGENVIIDTNKSYAVGKMLFLSVKGHASADVNNAELFTISGVTFNPTSYTFFCGVGAAWSLTGIGYCYANENQVAGRVTSGQYFHICATIPIK